MMLLGNKLILVKPLELKITGTDLRSGKLMDKLCAMCIKLQTTNHLPVSIIYIYNLNILKILKLNIFNIENIYNIANIFNIENILNIENIE